MTSAERLVKNLCEARRAQIENDRREGLQAANRLSDDVAIKDLPVKVRRDLTEYYRCTSTSKALKQRIKEAGFEISYGDEMPPAIGRLRSLQDAAKAKVNDSVVARIGALTKLRTDATIDTIGKSPTQVRERLEKLRSDVARV